MGLAKRSQPPQREADKRRDSLAGGHVMRRSQSQKQREIDYVGFLVNKLNREWIVMNYEAPDFTISDFGSRFGLEVTQVFRGPEDEHGAPSVRNEKRHQRCIDRWRTDYEAVHPVALSVKIIGRLPPDGGELLSTLIGSGIHEEPLHSQRRLRVGPKTTVQATRALRPDWLYIDDRVDFVTTSSGEEIDSAIDRKAKNLPRYIRNCGDDVRLLIVLDRTMNSGKVVPTVTRKYAFQGFTKVYLANFPLDALELQPLQAK